jgi:hypothetical protein
MISTTPSVPRTSRDTSRALIVISVGILATTLTQTGVLAGLPLRNLLKNALHVSRTENAAFFFWAGLAWYLKPFAGLLTDAFPIQGSRRKSYILLGASLAALSWLALIVTPQSYSGLLLVTIIINVFMVLTSTAVGGYLVETAQAVSGSGRLTALRQFVQQSCSIVNGPVAGFLASIAFGWTAAVCGSVMFMLVPVTILCLREQRPPSTSYEVLAGARQQLLRIIHARTMWAAAGLMALFYIAPGFGTALFYKQQNSLHLTTQAQGFLQFIAGVCGVAAATSYGSLCSRMSLRSLLVCSILAATVVNFGYLFYSTYERAQIIDGLNGLGSTLAELALMDLAVRATPAGCEGLGFSLMVSIRNLAIFGTDWFGARLLDHYHVSFGALVVTNSLTTVIAAPLVLLLPWRIVGSKDGESWRSNTAAGAS